VREAPDAFRSPQEPPEESKIVPRGTKESLRSSQEAPKTTQDRSYAPLTLRAMHK